MKFLRNFAAAFLAIAVFFGSGFFFFLIILASIDTKPEFTVRDNSILKIRLTEPLADRDFVDDFESFDLFGASINRIGVVDLRRALEQAASDDKIRGVVLYAPTVSGGYALAQEAREALSDFKLSGKPIWAYGELMTEAGFYMASVANKVIISPEGALEWNGLDAELTFFKNAFDKLDIEPQIFRVGDYKSAVEPFILDKMSAENKEQMSSMLNSLYKSMLDDMAPDLDLTSADLLQMSDQMKIRSLADAQENGLIAGTLYEQEFQDLVATDLGLDDAGSVNWISYRQYNQSFSKINKSKNKIAVVIAEGDILMAKEQQGLITPRQFIDELRRARNDKNVKAVVFRINSPGGDALASDLIWHEVKMTAEVKPVIASMSNYAASGGYYIAMAADSIVAEPTTLTGSIGIFSVIFNIGDFMANKLGITTDRVTTGSYSNLYTATRSLSSTEKQIIQNSLNSRYESFTAKAAEGRGMSIEQLKGLASGRVWTGAQAYENGLG
jgi:protease-4